jgi:hypothetical protein
MEIGFVIRAMSNSIDRCTFHISFRVEADAHDEPFSIVHLIQLVKSALFEQCNIQTCELLVIVESERL